MYPLTLQRSLNNTVCCWWLQLKRNVLQIRFECPLRGYVVRCTCMANGQRTGFFYVQPETLQIEIVDNRKTLSPAPEKWLRKHYFRVEHSQSIMYVGSGKLGRSRNDNCLIDKLLGRRVFLSILVVISIRLNYNDLCGYQKPISLSTLTTIFSGQFLLQQSTICGYAIFFSRTHTRPPTTMTGC